MIVKTGCGIDGAFYSTNCDEAERSLVQEILNNCTFLEADFAATLTQFFLGTGTGGDPAGTVRGKAVEYLFKYECIFYYPPKNIFFALARSWFSWVAALFIRTGVCLLALLSVV